MRARLKCGLLALILVVSAPYWRAEAAAQELDLQTLRSELGGDGTVEKGQLKVTIPQNDLDVTVDGFQIVPPMGLGSWAAFAPRPGGGAVVMGDLVLRESEVAPVKRVLVEHGLTATALHKHFLEETPRVVFMHIGGTGSEQALGEGVRATLDEIAAFRGGSPAEGAAQSVQNTLDVDRIAGALGHDGSMSRGVYKVTIGREDLGVEAHGIPVSSFMGLSTWASWQGTPDHAAVAGDFAMSEDEVAPVVQALVQNGIEVVSIHTHMVHDDPQVFFLHYWGTGEADALARRGLREALDRTGAG